MFYRIERGLVQTLYAVIWCLLIGIFSNIFHTTLISVIGIIFQIIGIVILTIGIIFGKNSQK